MWEPYFERAVTPPNQVNHSGEDDGLLKNCCSQRTFEPIIARNRRPCIRPLHGFFTGPGHLPGILITDSDRPDGQIAFIWSLNASPPTSTDSSLGRSFEPIPAGNGWFVSCPDQYGMSPVRPIPI